MITCSVVGIVILVQILIYEHAKEATTALITIFNYKKFHNLSNWLVNALIFTHIKI